MNDVTRILSAVERGDRQAAEQLLPLVYDELRRLAAQKLAREKPGMTLQATALVHDAYLRLVGGDDRAWAGRGHFFAAAAEAMRRILVESARRKHSARRAGLGERQELDGLVVTAPAAGVDVLALDEALGRLAARDPEAAELVKLRFFVGLTTTEAADALGLPARSAGKLWTYARSFLAKEMAAGAE